jgi:type II secretory pathway pseudopilin PulG
MLGITLTIVYVVALITSAVAALGSTGLFPAIVVISCWGFVYQRHADSGRLPRLSQVLIVLLLLIVTLAILLPSVQSVRESSRRGMCAHNLRLIWYGLDQYRREHGDFPAASTADGGGTPLLSWRVALLPFLERNDVYRRIDQTKPWNDAANDSATATPIHGYACPSDASVIQATSYFAVVDPRTIWRHDQTEGPKAATDSLSATILLIEAFGRNTAWAAPIDLTFDEARRLLTTASDRDPGHQGGRHVVFADGTVGFVGTPLDLAAADALLTSSGGEEVDANLIEIVAPRQSYRMNRWALVLFLFLSLLPIAGLERDTRPT